MLLHLPTEILFHIVYSFNDPKDVGRFVSALRAPVYLSRIISDEWIRAHSKDFKKERSDTKLLLLTSLLYPFFELDDYGLLPSTLHELHTEFSPNQRIMMERKILFHTADALVCALTDPESKRMTAKYSEATADVNNMHAYIIDAAWANRFARHLNAIHFMFTTQSKFCTNSEFIFFETMLERALIHGNIKLSQILIDIPSEQSHVAQVSSSSLCSSSSLSSSYCSLHDIRNRIRKLFPGFETIRFVSHKILTTAVQGGNADLINILHESYSNPIKVDLARVVGTGGHSSAAEWLRGQWDSSTFHRKIISIAQAAAQYGHVALLDWLFTYYCSGHQKAANVDSACINNKNDDDNNNNKNDNNNNNNGTDDDISRNENTYDMNEYDINESKIDLVALKKSFMCVWKLALENKQREVCFWAIKKGIPCHGSFFAVAAAMGDVDLLKMAIQNGCVTDTVSLEPALRAAKGEHLAMLRWLFSQECNLSSMDILLFVAAAGDLDLLLSMVKRYRFPMRNFLEDHGLILDTVMRAAGRGHLHIIQWLDQVNKNEFQHDDEEDEFRIIERDKHEDDRVHMQRRWTIDINTVRFVALHALDNGQVGVLRWLETLFPDDVVICVPEKDTISQLARKEDLRSLYWIMSHMEKHSIPETKSTHAWLQPWIQSQVNIIGATNQVVKGCSWLNIKNICANAAMFGQVRILKFAKEMGWLRDHAEFQPEVISTMNRLGLLREVPSFIDICVKAESAGHLEVLQLLHGMNFPLNLKRISEQAKRLGDTFLEEWVCHQQLQASSSSCCESASSGKSSPPISALQSAMEPATTASSA